MFFAWHEEPKYRRAVPDPCRVRALDHQEEQRLREGPPAQASSSSSRWAITEKCQGDPSRFKQEYPVAKKRSTWNAFDMGAIDQFVSSEPATGELERVRVGVSTRVRFRSRTDGHGRVRVWQHPGPRPPP